MTTPDPNRSRLVLPVALCTMLAWLSSLGFAFIGSRFEPLTITTPVMLLLAGYVFGISITKQKDDKHDA